MNLTGIIAISGRSGLYKVIAQGKNNLIVESLEDRKRFPAYASDRISALEDISIYTIDEDVPLKAIYKSIFIKENGGNGPSHKDDAKKLEVYLLEVLPNYDRERVYLSDIKKLFQWYNLLIKAGELKLEEEAVETETPVAEEDNKEEKPAKKAPAKKTAKVEKEDKVSTEKPVKKAPAKKSAEKAGAEKEKPAAKKASATAAKKTTTKAAKEEK